MTASTELDLFTGLQKPNSLAVWAEDARQAAGVARSLAPTPFVPDSLRHKSGDPDERLAVTAANVTAAILTGAELGLTPMASLRSVVVIQGTPTMTALAMRGLVQSRGHEVKKIESDENHCIYEGRRFGEGKPERVVWTIDRARQLGLTSRDNWKRQPEAMLVARASSECCRLIAADVLLGVPYSLEEMQDEAGETEPQRTARRRAQRQPAPMPEPELDEAPAAVPSQEEPAPPEPVVEGEPITARQLTALNAALANDLGLTDRDDKLAYLSGELGRDIASSKEITKDEASRLIDRIKAWAEPANEAPALPEPELPEGGAS